MTQKKKGTKNTRKKKPVKRAIPVKTSKQEYLAIAIVLAVTIIVYISSLNNGFVNWDDDINLLDNPNMSAFNWENIKGIFSSTVIGGYNPLSIFTLAVENALFGMENAFIYHLDNLLLHLVGVFFVYLIGSQLGLNTWASALLALLFGIHPMRVESVAWVTERKDVLFGAFYLAGFYCYLKYLHSNRKEQKWWYWTLGLFVFSLFSKIQAVALPLSMLAADYYFQRPLKLKLIMEKWAFFLLSLVVGLLGIYFLQAQGSLNSSVNDSFSLFDRLLIGFYSLGVYLVKWIVPYEMAPMYPYPSSLTWVYYVMPLGIIALLGGLYVAYKKGYKALVFGAAFFLFNIFFVLQVLGAGQGFLADRFTYIPYLGLFFIMAWYFQWVLENRKPWATLIKGIAIAYLALFAVMTWRQIKIWENGGALWTHAIQVSEKNTTVWKKRGQYLRSVGQRDQAMADFNMALSLNPQEADLYNSRGKTYFDMGDANKALEDYSRAIQLDQSEAEFFSNRGAALGSLRRFNEAITDLNQAIQLNPDYTSAYRNRLQVLYELGRLEESLADHQVFLAQRPNDTEIVVSRAIIYQQLGRYQEALQDINRGIQLNGTNGGFYYQRALIQYDLGNIPAAKQDVQLAQKYGWQNIDPKFLQ